MRISEHCFRIFTIAAAAPSSGKSSAATFADRQPFLTVKPTELFVAHHDAFPADQESKTPIPEPAALDRQFAQPATDRLIVGQH